MEARYDVRVATIVDGGGVSTNCVVCECVTCAGTTISPTTVSNPCTNSSFLLCRPSLNHAQVHLEYSANQEMSKIAVSSYYGVSNATLRVITKGVDAVSYLGRGR